MISDDDSKYRRSLFDGRERNFPYWEHRFVARAFRKEFNGILDGSVAVPKFGVDYDFDKKPATEEVRDRIEKNLHAYSELISGIDTETPGGKTAFLLVMKTRSSEYLNGNAYEGFKGLQKKYYPSTEVEHGELLSKYYTAKLRPGASAEDFITLMEFRWVELRRLGTKIELPDFLRHLLTSLGEQYGDLAQQLMRYIKHPTEPLSMEKVRDEVKTYAKRTEISL